MLAALDGEPDPGEVVWAWVPYEDDPAQGKDRPVLVVGLSIMGAAGLVMAATASITMATMLLVLVVWLTNLGGFVTATGSSDTVAA